MAQKKSQVTINQWLQQSAIRASRSYFTLAFVYVVSIIVYDAFKLITPDILLQRWTMASILLTVTALIWYLARTKEKSSQFYANLLYCLIALGIGFASFNVFIQRGMASRAVALYAVPIIVSALLLQRSAIFMTAIISVAAYSLAAIRYAVLNPSEGYKIELYGEVGFYSALFFVLATLLWSIVRSKNADPS
ncbi:hypothetical protein BH23PAT2_BH23PAT2_02010 [soil metagenome]